MDAVACHGSPNGKQRTKVGSTHTRTGVIADLKAAFEQNVFDQSQRSKGLLGHTTSPRSGSLRAIFLK